MEDHPSQLFPAAAAPPPLDESYGASHSATIAAAAAAVAHTLPISTLASAASGSGAGGGGVSVPVLSLDVDHQRRVALEHMLHANTRYATHLRTQIDALELALRRNAEKRRLLTLIAERNAVGAGVGPPRPPQRRVVFSAPWFVDETGAVPPENADTLRKQALRGAMPMRHVFFRCNTHHTARRSRPCRLRD